jgi:hypothetical protein
MPTVELTRFRVDPAREQELLISSEEGTLP